MCLSIWKPANSTNVFHWHKKNHINKSQNKKQTKKQQQQQHNAKIDMAVTIITQLSFGKLFHLGVKRKGLEQF